MRSRVAGATRGLPAKASDAVDGETRARAATAASVGRPVGGRSGATRWGTSRRYRVEARGWRAYRWLSNRFDGEGFRRDRPAGVAEDPARPHRRGGGLLRQRSVLRVVDLPHAGGARHTRPVVGAAGSPAAVRLGRVDRGAAALRPDRAPPRRTVRRPRRLADRRRRPHRPPHRPRGGLGAEWRRTRPP